MENFNWSWSLVGIMFSAVSNTLSINWYAFDTRDSQINCLVEPTNWKSHFREEISDFDLVEAPISSRIHVLCALGGCIAFIGFVCFNNSLWIVHFELIIHFDYTKVILMLCKLCKISGHTLRSHPIDASRLSTHSTFE